MFWGIMGSVQFSINIYIYNLVVVVLLFYLKGSLVVVVFDVFIRSSEQQHSGTAVLQNQQ